jgi:GNAT-family acetyltransferase (TIGR03103 family)
MPPTPSPILDDADESPTLNSWNSSDRVIAEQMKEDVCLHLGWGKLIFAHTFRDQARIAEELLQEQEDERNIAFYVPDPHVITSQAPQDIFLDPSHTFRCWLDRYRPSTPLPSGFIIRHIRRREDMAAINRILKQKHMVPVKEDLFWQQRNSPMVTVLLAEDLTRQEIIGLVMGVDHRLAFNDPENGASLWALAVDTYSDFSGVGEVLVRTLLDHFRDCKCAYLDLSVMHNNQAAIALYRKLDFERIPVFTIKRKNTINEPLYTTELSDTRLNPYAMIIVNEAKRRGIQVEVIDAEFGLFSLSFGGMQIICRESLTELTSAVALSLCDNKHLTWKLLRRAGLSLPAQQIVAETKQNNAFLSEHGAVVVKPARGEQGKGVAVDIRTPEEMEKAIAQAGHYCEDIVLEEMVSGLDLRIVVIDYQIVAAAIRKPPRIVGNGRHTIRQLIEKQSQRRMAQTGGESSIPLDSETKRCVASAGHTFEDILPENEELQVRKTANLHTGGIMEDVTNRLSDHLRDAAVRAAEILKIPVVGLDFIVPEPESDTYAIIEANERPGLANHEPQPTAKRFVDLLFPGSISIAQLNWCARSGRRAVL